MGVIMDAKPEVSSGGGSAAFKENSYDPLYDPLCSRTGHGQAYAPTYWVGTAGSPPEDDGPITTDIDADVVIIGSGFTGLATALNLAEEHGVKAHVIEAKRAVWGCTRRHGRPGQKASGHLSRSQVIQRWGGDCSQRV